MNCDWIVTRECVEGYENVCTRCGEKDFISCPRTHPIPVKHFIAITNAFCKEHEKCKERAVKDE